MKLDVQDIKTEDEQLSNVYYIIDPADVEKQGRSFEALLLVRHCASCKKEIVGLASLPRYKDQIKKIAKCCSEAEDFLRPGMPLQEIVFRLLLKEGNRPMAISDLHYAITEDLARPTHPMNISAEALMNILKRDRYYGFKETDERPKPRRAKK